MASGLNPELIAALVAAVAVPVAAGITWIGARRKNDADASSSYATAAHVSVETMMQVLTELRREVDALTKENAKLVADTIILHNEVAMLRETIRTMGGTPEKGSRNSDPYMREWPAIGGDGE